MINSLDEVAQKYIDERRYDAEREVRYFKVQKSLRAAVEKAALCQLPSGKRHSHQWRIPAAALEKACQVLLASDLMACQTFDDLHELIRSRIGSIHRIGELTVYDVAHRIGAFLGLEPEFVYLHCGVRDGAAALGINPRRERIELGELPPEFHRLKPHEIEDCLCIFKDVIRKIMTGRGDR